MLSVRFGKFFWINPFFHLDSLLTAGAWVLARIRVQISVSHRLHVDDEIEAGYEARVVHIDFSAAFDR